MEDDGQINCDGSGQAILFFGLNAQDMVYLLDLINWLVLYLSIIVLSTNLFCPTNLSYVHVASY